MNRTTLVLSFSLALVACSATPANVSVLNVIEVTDDAGATSDTPTGDEFDAAPDVLGVAVDAASEAETGPVPDAASGHDAATSHDAAAPADAGTDAAKDAEPAPDAAPPITCTVAGVDFNTHCKNYAPLSVMYFCTDGDAGPACPSGDRLIFYGPSNGQSWCCGR